MSNFCASALHYQRGLLEPFQVFSLAGQCSLFVRKKKQKKKNSFILACKKLQNWDLGKGTATETAQTKRSKTKSKQNKTKQASFISVTFLAQTNLLRIKKLLCFALVLAPFLFLFSHETKAMKVFQQYLPRSGQRQGMKQDWHTWASRTPYAGFVDRAATKLQSLCPKLPFWVVFKGSPGKAAKVRQ